ncbi:MAG: hypothetical protein HYY48_11770 [Gammaproteobacteria bacterium]|nr:hypothetical protein [Gammaproteobacteria bacterium]
MQVKEILGWDIGGAHLKMARIDARGAVLETRQFPTPLWLGLHSLAETLGELQARFARQTLRHAVTMTGELSDIFPSRMDGVRSLLELFARYFEPDSTVVYTWKGGLIPFAHACERRDEVASANWHATARFVAAGVGDGILVDVGSTTADVIPFKSHRLCNRGGTDQERLRSGELVYAGIVRTPVMAIVQRVPFDGQWQNVAAEYFASSADIYRITGELDEADDLMPTADHGGKSVTDSVRRLARMLGTDPHSRDGAAVWQDLAQYIAERQLDMIDESFSRVAAGQARHGERAVVGAGCGRFIARKLAARHGHRYIDFNTLLPPVAFEARQAAVAATAVAVAQLARLEAHT